MNEVTVADPFTMPLINNLLDQLSEARYLSKLGLNKGFYQIPVKEADREKTAFFSSWGKYELNRMPFGLKNTPATFQRAMNRVLDGQEDHSAAYINDVVLGGIPGSYQASVRGIETKLVVRCQSVNGVLDRLYIWVTRWDEERFQYPRQRCRH